MTRWLPVVLIAALAVGIVLALGRGEQPWPSVTNRGPAGYHAAFAYLERQGREVVAWSEEIGTLPEDATLILAFPAITPPDGGATAQLVSWVRGGGDLVLLPSPNGDLPDPLIAALRLESARPNRDPPLWPFQWRDWARARGEWTSAEGKLAVSDPKVRLTCPTPSQALYLDADGWPRVCRWMVGDGQVTLVPDASVFVASRLPLADNLDFLEEVAPATKPVLFYERGFSTGAEGTVDPVHAAGLRALVAQVVLLYGAAVYAVARGFGPPRRALRDVASSLARDVRVLGELHRAGGHADEAAEAMLTMARRLQFGGEGQGPPEAPPHEFTGGEQGLLALARKVAEMSGRRG